MQYRAWVMGCALALVGCQLTRVEKRDLGRFNPQQISLRLEATGGGSLRIEGDEPPPQEDTCLQLRSGEASLDGHSMLRTSSGGSDVTFGPCFECDVYCDDPTWAVAADHPREGASVRVEISDGDKTFAAQFARPWLEHGLELLNPRAEPFRPGDTLHLRVTNTDGPVTLSPSPESRIATAYLSLSQKWDSDQPTNEFDFEFVSAGPAFVDTEYVLSFNVTRNLAVEQCDVPSCGASTFTTLSLPVSLAR